jgi:hypothetical protein
VLSNAVATALAGQAAVVVADATVALTDVLASLRTVSPDDAVIVLILPDVSAINRAMLLAALGPLAIELAPRRIAAIDVTTGAASERVIAAGQYLASACSITGQSLRVT